MRPSKIEISQERVRLLPEGKWWSETGRAGPALVIALTRCFSVSIISVPSLIVPGASRHARLLLGMMGRMAGRQYAGLEPGAYQRDVGRAGDQQRDGERQMDTLAGGLEDRSHGRKHPAILAEEVSGILFCGIYLLVYDSGTASEDPRKRPEMGRFSPRTGREMPGMAAQNLKPGRLCVDRFYRSRMMPYALFSNDAKLSKAYPTEADVWKQSPRKAASWSMSYPRRKGRRRGRCWTMITRSGRASRTRMKIPPETRPRPSAKPGRSCSWRP